MGYFLFVFFLFWLLLCSIQYYHTLPIILSRVVLIVINDLRFDHNMLCVYKQFTVTVTHIVKNLNFSDEHFFLRLLNVSDYLRNQMD